MTVAAYNFAHLAHLTDERGIFEHADRAKPRREHGYCVDDVARALIVLQRANATEAASRVMMVTYRAFLADAQVEDGRFVNRLDVDGEWHGEPEVADHWGRALWALGTVVARDRDREVVDAALASFERGAHHRTISLRSMMWAALGAAEILRSRPHYAPARALLSDAATMVPSPSDREWPWPERRLTYANAVVPEVLIIAGALLRQPGLVQRGVALLRWLVVQESRDGVFSVTPVGGWRAGEIRNRFDQQPIEVAALVDACATAFDVTGDAEWLELIDRGYSWFGGVNDSQTTMFEPATGAGFDGLTASGRNENQGAESTLCYLSVAERYHTYVGEPAWSS